MFGAPNLNSQQKLKAYLQSASISENLIDEFEKEFEKIVSYIIQISQKTEKVFSGTNTIETKEIIKSLIKVCDISSNK